MPNRIYQFAEFRLSLADGCLQSGNSSARLQEKPLQLLTALLDHPQSLVSRQQLRERMWDSRTVVDFEQGINVAMRKVRDALGDSADSPQFIETIARKGYRFLVPVELIEEAECETESAPSRARHTRPRLIAMAVGMGLVCVVGLGSYVYKTKAPKEPVVHSLAVLPLQDLSPDTGQEYLVDGITDEIITGLAQVLPIRVISRTSVMKYRQVDKPIAQIARELGVDAIVEGSVTRSGERITVNVQLIDATADRHLWAQHYERRLQDILMVEEELSQTIASQIHSTLNARRTALPRPGPVDPTVYELCLLGRYHWNKRTPSDFVKAEDYFQQAIARDPHYAPAHAGLADVYALASSYGATSIEAGAAKAMTEAHRALALNDDLAEAHATLGFVHLAKLSEWSKSEAEFRRALEIDPNYANAHHWIAYDLWFFGRKDEALEEIAMARRLDPLSAVTNADEGQFLYAVRRFDDAAARLQRAIELAPEFGQPHATLALLELEQGHSSDAVREARAALALDPDNPRTMGEVGFVLASTGEVGRAKELLTRLQSLAHAGSSFSFAPAMIEIGLGQEDQAVATLRDILVPLAQLGLGLGSLSQWHIFDALPDNARYRELVSKPGPL
jgi:TolB-like protein/DNA-binding winged helix-turn-helix (wHTH) protein/Tfp pilus assembly protein PilF